MWNSRGHEQQTSGGAFGQQDPLDEAPEGTTPLRDPKGIRPRPAIPRGQRAGKPAPAALSTKRMSPLDRDRERPAVTHPVREDHNPIWPIVGVLDNRERFRLQFFVAL